MDAINIISILWIVGSIACCVGGCHRSRVLGRKIHSLEEKLEKIAHPQVVYSAPVSTNTYPTAPAHQIYTPPHSHIPV
jgi:hypothetical protein